MNLPPRVLSLIAILLLSTVYLFAEKKLPVILSDHLVLQGKALAVEPIVAPSEGLNRLGSAPRCSRR
jgi:hypothetical protein